MKTDSAAIHSSIINNLTDSVIITDSDYKITHWLAASEKIFGHSREEVITHPVEKFLCAPRDRLIPTDEFTAGISCRHKSGTEIIIRIVNKTEQKERILWICRDITAFKKIEWLMNTFHDQVQVELEKLVNKKTADLKMLNDQLENRVAERTREVNNHLHSRWLVDRSRKLTPRGPGFGGRQEKTI